MEGAERYGRCGEIWKVRGSHLPDSSPAPGTACDAAGLRASALRPLLMRRPTAQRRGGGLKFRRAGGCWAARLASSSPNSKSLPSPLTKVTWRPGRPENKNKRAKHGNKKTRPRRCPTPKCTNEKDGIYSFSCDRQQQYSECGLRKLK